MDEKESNLDIIRDQFDAEVDKAPNYLRNYAKTKVRPHYVQRLKIDQRRSLRGHLGKIYDACWSPNGEKILSISQDSRAVLWDPDVGIILCSASLCNIFPISCAFGPKGKKIAVGDFENRCSIYKVDERLRDESNPRKGNNYELQFQAELEHDSFVSDVEFIDKKHVLTASGDSRVNIWDLSSNQITSQILAHEGGCSSISMSSNDENLILSGGAVDRSARLWDRRLNGNSPVKILNGNMADINQVRFFKAPNAVATCGEDSTVRLYDLRTELQISKYETPAMNCGAVSFDFSLSGAFLFVGYDFGSTIVYDTLTCCVLGEINGHKQKVSSVCVQPNGFGVLTASYDNFIQIWA